MKAERVSRLTTKDCTALVESFLRSRGERGARESELGDLLVWANEVVVGYGLILLVLEGRVEVRDFTGGKPSFTVLPEGTAPTDGVQA